MSKHVHVVLHINVLQSQQWSPEGVVMRWHLTGRAAGV
ncbi:hypothetical Protein YC6258_03480 [Gynuella sunshinyii YC6258]|uniref:Uncharacterized protein n=1 Tax=Gynuella sunshinyii YC6258 TaxID=1445510 RepID=A0A0C5VMH0_9GAMM|nr:hypothetical Protein YC6258_03480 [Gynuella sunshinyii YC6258]